MKTAGIGTVRVPPASEKSCSADRLADDETLSGFAEDAGRREAIYRRAQAAFITRGLASQDAANASGRYVSAATVLGNLKRHLKNAHKKPAIVK